MVPRTFCKYTVCLLIIEKLRVKFHLIQLCGLKHPSIFGFLSILSIKKATSHVHNMDLRSENYGLSELSSYFFSFLCFFPRMYDKFTGKWRNQDDINENWFGWFSASSKGNGKEDGWMNKWDESPYQSIRKTNRTFIMGLYQLAQD